MKDFWCTNLGKVSLLNEFFSQILSFFMLTKNFLIKLNLPSSSLIIRSRKVRWKFNVELFRLFPTISALNLSLKSIQCFFCFIWIWIINETAYIFSTIDASGHFDSHWIFDQCKNRMCRSADGGDVWCCIIQWDGETISSSKE